jgi:hypothetical protein
VPLIVRFERQKNEALDDRQRALEALAQTVSNSAEQISIAAAGLNQIAELTQKNVRHAEQLPHKLQEKIAEFQAQLGAATDAEKEELERELLSLRTSESERLESVSQRIAKSAADWMKVEQATHQHLTAATEALAKLSLGTASAIGKAQVAAEQALSQARIEAARSLGEASGQATRALEASKQAGIAALETKLAAATDIIVERVARELSTKLSRAPISHTPAEPSGPATSIPSDASAAESNVSVPATATTTVATPIPAEAPSPEPPGAAPKRARKSRKDEPVAPTGLVPPALATATNDVTTSKSTEAPASAAAPASSPPEPPPVIAEKIAEIAPVAPLTVHPFPGHFTDGGAATDTAPEKPSPIDAAKALRNRPAPKKPNTDVEPSLGLELDATHAAACASERVISSYGATRLIVTSYIGIGNRLYIRGEGPGLTWEKGVPLQFVSIGKWRWETSDASAPIHFKLYKNDEIECAALGTQSVDAGYQQELTAGF